MSALAHFCAFVVVQVPTPPLLLLDELLLLLDELLILDEPPLLLPEELPLLEPLESALPSTASPPLPLPEEEAPELLLEPLELLELLERPPELDPASGLPVVPSMVPSSVSPPSSPT